MAEEKLGWNFPKLFWSANISELFERAAYYGMFIALTLYLTRNVGFTDIETGWVVAFFAAFLYFLMPFMGAVADKINFRRALIIAFSLLTVGYALLGAFHEKWTAIVSLIIIILGGALVKPIIAGTTAKCSDEKHRARAFSIFYLIINIGSFSGKTIAKPLRVSLGLEYINYYAACMAFIGLLIVIFTFKNVQHHGEGKSAKQVFLDLIKVVKNVRFMTLILIVAGFWAIQGQLYATLPKYAIRLIGENASPEWLANINPFMIVFLVVPITYLARKMRPIGSIMIAMFLVPFSAVIMSLSPLVAAKTGVDIHLFGNVTMHPITLVMIFGIMLLGFAECFLSPRFYEYVSKQAPAGEVGTYMGYSYLTSFFAWFVGFIMSGYLLNAFCPDPKTIAPDMLSTAYDHAHYIWYVFAGVGFLSFALLLVFRFVTDAIDRKNHVAEKPPQEEPIPFIEEE